MLNSGVLIFVLGGEMLSVAEPFLQQQMHPTVIISAFRQALEDLVEILREKIRSVRIPGIYFDLQVLL